MRIHYPRERWSQAYTANVSIGQGYDLVTPLQLAMVYATVANGGISYYPQLVQNVISMDRTANRSWTKRASRSFRRRPKFIGDLRYDVSPRSKSSWPGRVSGKW